MKSKSPHERKQAPAPEDEAAEIGPEEAAPEEIAGAERAAEERPRDDGEGEPEGEPEGDAESRARIFEDRWMRSEAELANFRRRALRDRREAEIRAQERVLAEVLSLADDLERALDAVERKERSGPIFQGVQLVHERVRDILRRHGVEVVDPMGEPFDPHVAEALLELERAEDAPGTVVQVIEKGYRQGERLLRPAKVAVARPPSGKTPPAST